VCLMWWLSTADFLTSSLYIARFTLPCFFHKISSTEPWRYFGTLRLVVMSQMFKDAQGEAREPGEAAGTVVSGDAICIGFCMVGTVDMLCGCKVGAFTKPNDGKAG
jgi:hypothetical protein